MPDIQGSTAEWLTDKALRSVIAGVLRLPYERRVALMGHTVSRAIGPLAGYRKRAIANLAAIYPDMSVADQLTTADAVCDNFGRTLIENYAWRELGARLAGTPLTGDGLEAIATAKAAGQPVIFVTGHFGNHEVPRHVLTAKGYTIGGLYRPMGNPYFNAHYAKTMTDWGGPVFEQGSKGTMGFARHLKSGGMATLLFDVASSEGTAIPFLGKPAMTALSAAEMALRFNALLVPYFGIRQPDGLSFQVTVNKPIPRSDAVTMMTNATVALESQIADHKEQWFWVHRRWKNAG